MIHDSDSLVPSSCREHDEGVLQVMAVRQLEALRVGYRIGQYVEQQRAALQSESLTPEQREWLEGHIKEHEEWFAESVAKLQAEVRKRGANAVRLSKKG
jgi:hypothetical protein